MPPAAGRGCRTAGTRRDRLATHAADLSGHVEGRAFRRLRFAIVRVTGIDERSLGRQGTGTDFVVFIYEGGDRPGVSWSVDSYLLTEAGFTDVLEWLRENLPNQACYSVGAVFEPARPTADSEIGVVWVLGADLLNTDPDHWTPVEQRIAREMLDRLGRVTIP